MRKLVTLAAIALLAATKIASPNDAYAAVKIGENTTIETTADGTKIYRIDKEEYDDVRQDYIVVNDAKYSVDGKTLLAIPTDVKSFTVKEGTETVNISAITKYGNFYFGEDRDSGIHVKLEELILPKSLKNIDFNSPYDYLRSDDGLEEFFDWTNIVDIKKLTIKNKNLTSEELANLFAYFYKLEPKNLTAPKGAVTRKNKMLIYKKAVIKYYGKGGAVTVPKGIKKIQKYAFTTPYTVDSDWKPFKYKGAKITKITLPKSITTIEKGAFRGCKKLKTVKFESTSKLSNIGDYAFRNTKINTFPYMKKLGYIGRYAFTGTNLKSITVPYTTNFDRTAFRSDGSDFTIKIKGK